MENIDGGEYRNTINGIYFTKADFQHVLDNTYRNGREFCLAIASSENDIIWRLDLEVRDTLHRMAENYHSSETSWDEPLYMPKAKQLAKHLYQPAYERLTTEPLLKPYHMPLLIYVRDLPQYFASWVINAPIEEIEWAAMMAHTVYWACFFPIPLIERLVSKTQAEVARPEEFPGPIANCAKEILRDQFHL